MGGPAGGAQQHVFHYWVVLEFRLHRGSFLRGNGALRHFKRPQTFLCGLEGLEQGWQS